MHGNAVAPHNPGGPAIGIRRLQLAAYSASRSVVVGQEGWGEPVSERGNRAAAGCLTAGAPFRVVDVAPWPARAKHDYLIELHALRLEGVEPEVPAATDGEAHMPATSAIVRSGDGQVLAQGITEYREDGGRVGDHAEPVAPADAGVYALSADLLATVLRISRLRVRLGDSSAYRSGAWSSGSRAASACRRPEPPWRASLCPAVADRRCGSPG